MRSPEISALIEQYSDDDTAAFFLMTFDDGGDILWPPERGQRIATLRRCIRHLRIRYVNAQYLNIYNFPRGQSPLGWRMSELTGTPSAAAAVLSDFYDNGGFSRVMMVRPRLDGHLMTLRGEYRALRSGDRIIGHYGVELDITARTVRDPGDTFH